jgi:hypothetical protein
MQKITLYVGLNDKDTKTQTIKTKDAKNTIQNTLFNNGVDAFTIYQANGQYKHESGAITKEKTIIIELLEINDNIINKIINDLKNRLNQESILKQTQKIDIDFI